MFTANSHVNDRVEAFEATEYKQHNAILRNRRDGVFQDASALAGPDSRRSGAHRGCAFADFNRDGKIDDFKWGHRVIHDPNDARMIYITTFGGSVWHGPAVAR